MEIVTVFQAHHSKTNTGWFTTHTDHICSKEIENPDELCFAYYLPDYFYFAEGGWGHHMIELGNHPRIPNPISIRLIFIDFNNTVVINGNCTFENIVGFLKKTEYLSDDCHYLQVHLVGNERRKYSIPFSDKMMRVALHEAMEMIDEYAKQQFPNLDPYYRVDIEIC